ncbi:uncharacterized protein LOC116166470 [Photinus pyralis]|uniref:uncharacterized protein LOC116160304 n=1 Tax=Photinus pyralis TaxID=7054 RepID=UPI00126703FC|nr:uncharacterized protein LOC116160304 [Photinus pyralis]XP_031337282.1 uncharacterized protein LOC116166470 [Photinus pyralis]
MTATKSIKAVHFDLEIFTDASLSGWGAVCNGKTTFGWWDKSLRSEHINFLELQAILFGLKHFAINLNKISILVRTDNTTALSSINRMGSVKFKKLNSLAKEIWQWCEIRDLWLVASYIKSSDNWQADQASRILPPETEWALNDAIFADICKVFGEPEIDLFASRANRKCAKYVTWHQDPEAEAIDAFTINWSKLNFYAFPPFSLILKTLNKVVAEKAEGVIVVPFWRSQPWYPLLLKLAQGEPIFFGPKNNLVSSPYRSTQHPLSYKLILVAVKLSGRHLN